MTQKMPNESQYVVKPLRRWFIAGIIAFTILSICICNGFDAWENLRHANIRKVSVGHFFTDEIPYEAFGCNLTRVQVVERNMHSLPGWMNVNADTGQISGVPQEDDIGAYHLLFTGIGINEKFQEHVCKSFAKIFIVEVVQHSLMESLGKLIQNASHNNFEEELSGCGYYSSVVVGTLSVHHKKDPKFINFAEFAKHLQMVLNISIDLIQILKETNSLLFFRQLKKISILHSEDHTNYRISQNKPVYISWPITCGAFNVGSYLTHKVYRRSIEYSSDLSIGSFHLTSGDYGGLPHLRKRRGVFFGSITALEGTPVETSALPSRFSTSVLFTSVKSSINRKNSTSHKEINSTISSISNKTVFSQISSQPILHTKSARFSMAETSSALRLSSYLSRQSNVVSPKTPSMPYSTLGVMQSSVTGITTSKTFIMNISRSSSTIEQSSLTQNISASSSFKRTESLPGSSASLTSTSSPNSTAGLFSSSIISYHSPSKSLSITRMSPNTLLPTSETLTRSTVFSETLAPNRTSYTKSSISNPTTVFSHSEITSSTRTIKTSPFMTSNTGISNASSVLPTVPSRLWSTSATDTLATNTTYNPTSQTSKSTAFSAYSEIASSSPSQTFNTSEISLVMTSYTKVPHSSVSPTTARRTLSSARISSSTFYTNYSVPINKTVLPASSRSFYTPFKHYMSSSARSIVSSLEARTSYSISQITVLKSLSNGSTSMEKTMATIFSERIQTTSLTSKLIYSSSAHLSSSTNMSKPSPPTSGATSSVLETRYFTSETKSLVITTDTSFVTQTSTQVPFTSSSQFIRTSLAVIPSYSSVVISRQMSEKSSQSSFWDVRTIQSTGTISESSSITQSTIFTKSESVCCSSSKGYFNSTFLSVTSSTQSTLKPTSSGESTFMPTSLGQSAYQHLSSIQSAFKPTISSKFSRQTSRLSITTTSKDSPIKSSSSKESSRPMYSSISISSVSSFIPSLRFTSRSTYVDFSSKRQTVNTSYATRVPQSLFTIASSMFTISSLDISFRGTSALPSTAIKTSDAYSRSSRVPNSGPQMLNSIGRLTAYVGRLFTLKIPYDTFYDLEDGFTNNLKLICRYSNGNPIAADFWIKFDNNSQTISGLPLTSDQTSQALHGLELELVAFDSWGYSARDVINIYIQKVQVSFLFSITATIDCDYTSFLQDSSLRIKLLNRIIQFYNTSQPQDYYALRIRNGSVMFSWSDTSVGSTTCNKTLIDSIFRKIWLSSGSPTPEFSHALLPEFPVLKLNLSYHGVCLLPPIVTPTPTRPGAGQGSTNVFVTYVVPLLAVAFICAVIIATLVFLSKRRKSKPSFLDKYTFKKGQPVLLPEEHELKTFPASAVILPEDYLYDKKIDKDKLYSEDYIGDPFDDEDGLIKENEAYGLKPFVNPPPPYHPEPKRGKSIREDYESPYLYPPPTYQLPPMYIQPENMTSEV